MLIVYSKADGLAASISGTNSILPDGPPFEAEVQNAVNHFGGVAEDYGGYRLNDESDAEQVQAILQAATVEMQLDGQGMPTGTVLYERLSVEASPGTAAVNAEVTVTATLPAGAADTEVGFAVEGLPEELVPVVGGQAQKVYAFADPGTYRVTVRSTTKHGQQTVGVVVDEVP